MMDQPDDLTAISPLAMRQRLESLLRAGLTHLPRPRAASPPPASGPAAPARRPQPLAGGPAGTGDPLAALRAEVAACSRCAELACSRTQTVFGAGDPRARLCFIGEAPGADEDRRGEPFVGAAGQLLTDIITKGFRLPRESVYICNVLKCRPPGNRNPEPDEIANCRDFLLRQLDILRPEFIVCLGRFAAQTLLQTTASVGKLRGAVHSWRQAQVVVTYHPSYLLREPSAKRQAWEDVQLMLRTMGVLPPGSATP